MDCNTYKSEITNEGHTFDECCLDALDFHQQRVWSGEKKNSPEGENYFPSVCLHKKYIRDSRRPPGGNFPEISKRP